MPPPAFLETFGVILFVTQAVDDRITLIRESLSSPTSMNIKKMVIVGGETKPVAHAVSELENTFKELIDTVITYKSLEDVEPSILDTESTVISLSELDRPIFKDMTAQRWNSFRMIFDTEKTAL